MYVLIVLGHYICIVYSSVLGHSSVLGCAIVYSIVLIYISKLTSSEYTISLHTSPVRQMTRSGNINNVILY